MICCTIDLKHQHNIDDSYHDMVFGFQPLALLDSKLPFPMKLDVTNNENNIQSLL